MKTQSLTDFRSDLTRIVREVEITGEPVVITDYHRPVVMLIQVPEHLKHDPRGVADAGVADLPDTL